MKNALRFTVLLLVCWCASIAHGAIAYVQSSRVQSTTASVSLTLTPTAGNCLVAFVDSFHPVTIGNTAVADNNSNTWNFVGTKGGGTGGGCAGAFFYAVNVKGGSTTITYTSPGGQVECAITVIEYSGVATVSALDVHAEATWTGASAATGSVTTTGPSDVLVAAVSEDQSNTVWTGPTGWNTRQNQGNSNVVADATADLLNQAANSYSATFTSSNNAIGGVSLIIALRQAVVGSVTVSESSLPSNHGAGTVKCHPIASGFSYAGTETFSVLSGPSGWTYGSVSWSGTTPTLTINCPAAATPPNGATGTLSMQDSLGHPFSVAIATPTLTATGLGHTSGTATITMAGSNTVWSQETPTGLFTTSLAGTSFAAASVSSNTGASDVVTGTGTSGTSTITDTSTGATSSINFAAGDQITQYGITLTFNKYGVTKGQFVMGDWWVVDDGSLAIAAMSPTPTNSAPYRNGMCVNPTLNTYWMDDRQASFSTTERVYPSLTISAGQSIVCTQSCRDNLGAPGAFTPTASGSGSTFGAGTWSVGVTFKTSGGETTVTKTTLVLTAGQNIVVPAITLPNQPDVTVNYYVANVASNTTVYLSTNAAGTGNVTLTAPGNTANAQPPASDNSANFNAELAAFDPLGDPTIDAYRTKAVVIPTDTISGVNGSPVLNVMILTVLNSAPVGNYFRPPYMGTSKPLYSADTIDRSMLKGLPIPTGGNAPGTTLANRKRAVARPWTNHAVGYGSSANAAQNSMGCAYGVDYSHVVADVAYECSYSHTTADINPMLYGLIQIGIDDFRMVQMQPSALNSNGGHLLGRMLPMMIAAKCTGNLSSWYGILSSSTIQDVAMFPHVGGGAASGWATSGNAYASAVIRDVPGSHYEAAPLAQWINSQYDTGGFKVYDKGEGYGRLDSPPAARMGVAAMLFDLTSVWNRGIPPYTDRWMRENDSTYRSAEAAAAATYNWDDLDSGDLSFTTLTATATAGVTSTITVASAANMSANRKIGLGTDGTNGSEGVQIGAGYVSGLSVPLTAVVAKTHNSSAKVFSPTTFTDASGGGYLPNAGSTGTAEGNYLYATYRATYGPAFWPSVNGNNHIGIDLGIGISSAANSDVWGKVGFDPFAKVKTTTPSTRFDAKAVTN